MTSLPNVETDDAGANISQAILVLMAYAGIKHAKDLAPRVGMSQQTLSRRMLTEKGWMFHEVVGIAVYFGVTLDELLNGLPSLQEWTARRLDTTARLQGFEPRTFCSVDDRSRRHLRIVKGGLTAESLPDRSGTRHLRAVS